MNQAQYHLSSQNSQPQATGQSARRQAADDQRYRLGAADAALTGNDRQESRQRHHSGDGGLEEADDRETGCGRIQPTAR